MNQKELPDDIRDDAPLDARAALNTVRQQANYAVEALQKVVDAIDRLLLAIAKEEVDKDE